MKKLVWYFKNKLLRLRLQYRLEQEWNSKYSAAKLMLGLPDSNRSELIKNNPLEKGYVEAFLRALVVEATEYNSTIKGQQPPILYSRFNRTQLPLKPDLIRWRHIYDTMDKLGLWGAQKAIYDLMKLSDSKEVASSDIKNFDVYQNCKRIM